MRYNKLIPILSSLITLFFLEIFFFNPKLVYVSLVILIIIYFFAIRQFVLASGRKDGILSYLILPVLFLFGIAIFGILIPSKFFVQMLFFADFIFVNIYFRTIYYLLLKPGKYQKNTLENMSSYGNFLAVYFTASGVYGLQSFLGINVWALLAFLLVFITAVIYQVFWANNILTKSSFFFIIILPLAFLEIAWAISFLSLSYYISGMLLAVCYYVAIGLIRYYLIGRLDKQIIKIYLIFGFISIFSVLLSSRWI